MTELIGNPGGYSGEYDPTGFVNGDPFTYPDAPAPGPEDESFIYGADTVTEDGEYLTHYWLTPGPVTVLMRDLSGPVDVEGLLVAGGGAGGGGYYGGGGGAGGALQIARQVVADEAGVVGDGGSPGSGGNRGGAGEDTTLGADRAVGGGGGGGRNTNQGPALEAGSAGGVATRSQGGSMEHTAGQGQDGSLDVFGGGGGGFSSEGRSWDDYDPVENPDLATNYPGGDPITWLDGLPYAAGGSGGGNKNIAGVGDAELIEDAEYNQTLPGGRGGSVGWSGTSAFFPSPGQDGTGSGGGGGGGDQVVGAAGGSGALVLRVLAPVSSFQYAQGAWWRINTDGTFAGVPVQVGDRVYVKNAAQTAHLTEWSLVRFTDDPWDRPAPPTWGCELPYWDGHRVLVEMFYFANPPEAPGPVTGLTAVPGAAAGELVASWSLSPVGTFTGYQAEAQEPDGSGTWVAVDVVGTSASYTFSGTTGLRTMRVRQLGLGGTIGPWTEVTAEPNWDITAPALPTVTDWKPESSYGRMVARFTTSAADNYQYEVSYQINSNSWVSTGWRSCSNNQAITFAAVTGTAGNTYRVRIRVRDALLNTSGYTTSWYYTLRPQVQDILPYDTGHWRSNTYNANTSNPTRPYQGYFSDPAFDYVGLAYYGTRWRDACNAQGTTGGKVTVTSMSVVLHREGGGNNPIGGEPVNVGTHPLTTNPGFVNGARPTVWNTAALVSLEYGQVAEPNLTAAQLAALRDGTHYGLAVSGQPYMFLYPYGAGVFSWYGKVRSLG